MQYILSQEELDALKAKQKFELGLAKGKLQKLCTKICNEMPATRSWDKSNKTPWGCLITAKENREGPYDWYCDECPVQEICPYPYQEYSQ